MEPNEHARYTRTLTPLLPPAVFERDPARVAFACAHLALLAALIVLIRHTDAPALHIGVSVLAGHSLFSLALFAHELSHGAILGRGWGRTALELVTWGPNLIAPTVWRVVHNGQHHAHANTLRDPDRRFARGEEGPGTRLYTRLFYPQGGRPRANPLLLLHFIPYVLKQTVGALLPGARLPLIPARSAFSSSERARVALELAVIASLQYLLYRLVGGRALAYLCVGPIAVGWASAFVMLYVFTNHFGRPLTARADPVAGSTSVIAPRLVDALHLHFSFHTEHHLYPSMASRHFPRLSALLQERFPAVYQRLPLGEAWRRAWRQPLFAAAPASDGDRAVHAPAR